MIKQYFVEYLKNLGPDDWDKKITSKWLVRDVVAHLIGWEKNDPEVIRKTWETKESPWWKSEQDYDEYNKKEVEFYKDWKPEDLIKELEHWQAKVSEEIKNIGEENLRKNLKLFDWLFDESEGSHYYHHLKQLKDILKNG